MNKKAIFTPMLAVVTVFLFTYLLYNGVNFIDKKGTVGESSFNIINEIYLKEDKINLYLEQAAKHSMRKAAINLANNGGFLDEDECGSYENAKGEKYNIYNILTTNGNDKNCYPRNLIDNYQEYFKKEFRVYLDRQNLIENFPKNYEYSIIEGNDKLIINGINKEKLMLSTKTEKSNVEANSDISVDFNQDLDYTFADYREIEIELVDPIKLCKPKEDANVELTASCFRNLLSSYNIEAKDNYILFTKDTGKSYFNQVVVIKFAFEVR